MTPEQEARFIFSKGPLTRAEIRRLPAELALEYFELMGAFIRELGEAGFTARREELREAVLRKIVNRS